MLHVLYVLLAELSVHLSPSLCAPLCLKGPCNGLLVILLPSCSVRLPSVLYPTSIPLLNTPSSSNVQYIPFFNSWALLCLLKHSLCSWHNFSCFGEASFKALLCSALWGGWGLEGIMLEGIKDAVLLWLGTDNWQWHSFKYSCKCLKSHMAFIFLLLVPSSSLYHSTSNHQDLPTEAPSTPSHSVIHHRVSS